MILERKKVTTSTWTLKLKAPHIAQKAKPGQFVIVIPDERGERIPLTIADWDSESITLVFMPVGTSTRRLVSTNRVVSICGPLGLPSATGVFGKVLCVGGCYGIASIYPVARELRRQGNKVITLIEGRDSRLLFWEERHREVADELIIVTRDGSKGVKGHVNRIIPNLEVDMVFVHGCILLERIVSNLANAPVRVLLTPIMIDGTGMCGVCRVIVGGQTKFACVDGPEFEGKEVDWDNLALRLSAYKTHEVMSLARFEEGYG